MAILVISCSVLFYLTELCCCLSVGLKSSCLDSFHGSLYSYLLYCDTTPEAGIEKPGNMSVARQRLGKHISGQIEEPVESLLSLRCSNMLRPRLSNNIHAATLVAPGRRV